MSVVSVVCCQVGVSATGCSLVHRIPTHCSVSECDHKSSIIRRLLRHGKKKSYIDLEKYSGVYMYHLS